MGKHRLVIEQLRQYVGKHGRAVLFWDWTQMAPRARARGSLVMGEGQLIGVYTSDVTDEQIVADIACTKAELGIRPRKERSA